MLLFQLRDVCVLNILARQVSLLLITPVPGSGTRARQIAVQMCKNISSANESAHEDILAKPTLARLMR